jgi:hypothetical protein
MIQSNLEILEKSQLSTQQAMAILQVMESERVAQNDQLATKGDLTALASAIKADLGGFATKADLIGLATKADLELSAAKLEFKLNDTLRRWIFGSTGVMLGAFYFLLNYARK